MKRLFAGFSMLFAFTLFGSDIAPVPALTEPRQKVCLNGQWQILDTNDDTPTPPEGEWQTIRVPISWDFKEKPISWYSKEVLLPAEWNDGRQIKLSLDAAREKYAVIVNGKTCFETDIGRPYQDVDITEAVKFGKINRILVKTRRVPTDPAYTVTILNAGITGDVWLTTTPPLQIEKTLLTTSVKEKTLSAEYRLRNETTVEQRGTIQGRVFDREGKKVLTMPPVKFVLPAGASDAFQVRQAWSDPILWGSGSYGSPYLYFFNTEIQPENTRTMADSAFERFGFREFSIADGVFLWNGKPFFIKGDVGALRMTHFASPAATAALAYRQRQSGINFLRLTYSDNAAWLETADELGMPVEIEPGMFGTHAAFPEELPKSDDRIIENIWTPLITSQFNRPSIVMWVPDNESFSVGTVSPVAMAKLRGRLDRVREVNKLCGVIRKLDPTRLIDAHHNYCLFALLDGGGFDRSNFELLNIHPYGELKSRINTEMKGIGFDYSVPILVGEVFAHPNQWFFNLDMVGAYADQFRCAKDYRLAIAGAAAAKGVGGMILCSLEELAGIGYVTESEVKFGPWSEAATTVTDPEKIGDIRAFRVAPRWPSLSGPGVKTEFIRGFDWNIYRNGENINWFDSHAPIFNGNVISDAVKSAFDAIGTEPAPPFTHRYPEVIVCTGRKDVLVTVKAENGGSPVAGCLTDSNGSAWFRLTAHGSYVAEAVLDGKLHRTRFTIDDDPVFSGRAGYDYLTWVKLGADGDAAKIRAELEKPAQLAAVLNMKRGEIVLNGDFKVADPLTGGALEWIGSCGLDAQAGVVTVPAGHELRQKLGPFHAKESYILRFEFRKKGAVDDIVFLSNQRFSGTGNAEEWRQEKFIVTFPQSEQGTHLVLNGGNGKVEFRSISIESAPEPEAKQIVKGEIGPFAPDAAGFIRDWLICGPFPQGSEEEKKQDFLTAAGGEANCAPKFNDPVDVIFSRGNYWRPGAALLNWRQFKSPEAFVNLAGQMRLRTQAITSAEPPYLCAYLYCVIESPVDCSTELRIGSDDGYRLYLNGELIGSRTIDRGAEPDQESYNVQLHKGRNPLMIRLTQTVGGWGIYLRFLKNNRPVENLRIFTE